MISTLTARGQTVVPASIRKAHGLDLASKLEWIDDGECIRVIPLGRDPIASARDAYRGAGLGQALLRQRAEDRARE
ncbi:MAG: AbrB family transcriptional regulator [Armatimonadetes bacterium CG_4_10_14_3_um_filter_66_18]|nr:AbrB/MazE/SpoVT family DNA-binding domain-containing protein [Armatimonadota bacterium]OIP03906.1 MAG: hypothetical protein AUJ96_13940 [Armatimonadetes bacterium CG2_30_66_41]PIU93971.1 MAG: AbrB family transcriptional regulator [Armatimonadetes bacterium CG06_land_8_20_14_3_00_66_21]PIX47561.1 MAG: AbrB family transcriptional regulator [Armatimonadetes bacterium CG_4_8_14_3_um_filter_66_20]PIY52635.1 MAG: AbrB family transcriptional regulator [Armatimonadetes bacterium CG_4_10_14_3_um_filt